jgi:Family of unknown function (DUF5670)
MLYTLAVVLVVLWLLGLVSSYTLGGFIHVLLVVAVIAVLIRIISGRKIIHASPENSSLASSRWV